VKSRRLFEAAENKAIQVSQLQKRGPLPGDIAEPHLDRERFAVGILRRFRRACVMVHHAGLMPGNGDHAQFAQSREVLTGFRVSLQRFRVAALVIADASELAFHGGNLPGITELFRATDTLFVSHTRFAESAQAEETIASFCETLGCHPLCVFVVSAARDGLEPFLRLAQET